MLRNLVVTRLPRSALAPLAVAAVLVAALTGCTDDPSSAKEPPASAAAATATGSSSATESSSSSPSTPTVPSASGSPTPDTQGQPGQPGTALAALEALPVKGRAPMTGYDRDQFGTEWDDAVGDFSYSRNGCDTRNDLLARDLQREVVESNGCVVDSGVLADDPYSGERNYYFDKHDNDYATDLDAEHIVALGNAWVTGAQQLSAEQRAELANDPINLMLVNPSLNRQKGDADFATWLPPNKEFRCSYAARQIRVKTQYHLWVTAPEKAAMERVLATCPGEPLAQPDPQDGHKASADADRPASSTQQPPQHATSKPAQSPGNGGAEVYYENCDAVRAAGAAPIHRGDPGYGSHLDRDGDGSACE